MKYHEKALENRDNEILALKVKLRDKELDYKELKTAYTKLSNAMTFQSMENIEKNKEIAELNKQLVKLKEREYRELTPEREKVLIKEIKNIQRSNNKKNRLIKIYREVINNDFKESLRIIEREFIKGE